MIRSMNREQYDMRKFGKEYWIKEKSYWKTKKTDYNEHTVGTVCSNSQSNSPLLVDSIS